MIKGLWPIKGKKPAAIKGFGLLASGFRSPYFLCESLIVIIQIFIKWKY